MKNKNDGGPAFPFDLRHKNIAGEMSIVTMYPGLSKRDYFAAKAMQGLIIDAIDSVLTPPEMIKKVSEISYDFADAMIKESQK